MFSALLNAQNKIFSIPITSVTWSISVPTNSTYTGSAQSVTVVSVSPVGATYSTSTTTATNAGGVASTTITGTAPYTGSFTSPNLTIIPATISGTAVNSSATYNASSQSGTVITGVTPAAVITSGSFTGSVNASGTNAGSYTSSITGTGNYTGTISGGTFTINQKQLTISTDPATITACPSLFAYQTMQVTGCGGLLSGGIGTLTVYLINKSTGAISLAPVSTNDNITVDAVSQTQGSNPKTGLSNGTNTINMCYPSGLNFYGFVFGGNSNYSASSVGAQSDFSCST
jgi:hypothetical protein